VPACTNWQDDQTEHPAHEVGSAPSTETEGSVHESDDLDRACEHACAEPVVQVIQAVKTSEATA